MHLPSSVQRLTAAIALAFGLAACQTIPQPPPDNEPPAEQPAPQPDPVALQEQELVDAIQMYVDGRYSDAIDALTPLSSSSLLPLSSQVKALKYIAFSHCVEGRRKPCRQHFDMALELDPTFQLTEAEKGHPTWGREFNNARAALRIKQRAAARNAS